MHSSWQASKTNNKQPLTIIELNSGKPLVKFPDTHLINFKATCASNFVKS
ncbi:MAG: hypothetical protein ACI97K_003046 [Glaciecola sp.]|jgi:hypothetical protein